MKRVFLCILLALLCISSLTGCVPPAIKLNDYEAAKIPEAKYETYLYEGGSGMRWRAALLKDQASPYAIEPGSLHVTRAVGGYADAMEFMKLTFRTSGIKTEQIVMHGKPVGYLMTTMPDIGDVHWFEVLLYEKPGKVIFDIREPMDRD
ncbi:MAG TPA: hypothetical protein VLH56_13930 [Dissulfurispiraceae bacterium]|nr:hypothetical protein [Dissulfurispiraceae bacterium]